MRGSVATRFAMAFLFKDIAGRHLATDGLSFHASRYIYIPFQGTTLAKDKITGAKFASGVKKLKSGKRLTIPRDFLRLRGWYSPKKAIDVLAERVEFGRVRFHRLEDVQARFDEGRARLAKEAETGDPGAVRRLWVFLDRHCVVSLDMDGRLRLGEEVVTSLGAKSDEEPDLYIETTATTLEVMSLEMRGRFDEEYGDGTTL